MSPGTISNCPQCGLRVGEVKEKPPSEDFLSLSRSNDPPVSAVEKIRMEYTETLQTLETLDSHIDQLYASIASFQAKRAPFEAKKRLYTSILHPIRRLPPEILSEIFLICTVTDRRNITFPNEDKNMRLAGSLNTCRMPWVLGQVCRNWRLVARSTTGLWTQVELSRMPANLSQERAAWFEMVLDTQLQRCGERPLTIFYKIAARQERHLQEQLLSLLCSRSSQWEHVFLEGNLRSFAPLSRCCGLVTSLKTLHIRFSEDDGRWVTDLNGSAPFSVFEDIPSLERLAISGDTRVILQGDNQLPWGRVVHYASRESDNWWPDLNEHFQVLPRLQNVQTCALDVAFPNSPGLPSQPTLELRFLHTLVLAIPDGSGVDVVEPLLGWLVLPSLRILRLPVGFHRPTALIGFLEGSRCSLEELTILKVDNRIMDDFGDLVEVFKVESLQGLLTLGVGGTRRPSETQRDASDTIFKVLTFADNSEQLFLPKLRNLVLHGPNLSWSDESLLNMVSSRRRLPSSAHGACRLTHLVFWNIGERGSFLPIASLDEFDALCEDGLTSFSAWGYIDWYDTENCASEVLHIPGS
ncbi:hypothetical protein V5O48_007065 [Marasmius crinis-equi]|uniref:F-box domain-containing protein n=1 Tax=Marasmius crinis-equi TaxID=585013 RepID=A0ABR3FI91_9AGAR